MTRFLFLRLVLLAVALVGCVSSKADHEEVAASEAPVATNPAGAARGDAAGSSLDGVVLPLVTEGRFIVDQHGQRVKLVSANWYGAESPDYVPGGLDRQDAPTIVKAIHALGFNSVRLPWSNELLRIRGINPGPFETFEKVVRTITDSGMLVILDNHTSRADWCCDDWDGNGLWYRDDWNPENRYTEDDWIADWRFMAARFKDNPRVIGAELRNEIRPAYGVTATWGGGDPKRDWRAAAIRGGDAVLSVAPDWLVFVGGLDWSTDFRKVYDDPIVLSVPHRLVYAPHDYPWFHEFMSRLKEDLGNRWGFILRQNERYTAPVWVSEIGASSVDSEWYERIHRYLDEADIDWAWWAINPTQSSQQPDSYARATNKRTLGSVESYGLLEQDWSAPSTEPTKQQLIGSLMRLTTIKEAPNR